MSKGPASRGSLPYVLPFGVFLFLLAAQKHVPLPARVEFPLRVLILAGVLWVVSRQVIKLRPIAPLASAAAGVAVFVLWVLPDILFPGGRASWLFQNSITGSLTSSINPAERLDPVVLCARAFRAVVLVPIIEELFWRAWLMRWLINPDFEKVALGAYRATAFWITAILFASEHGPYWDVGLLAGVAYNYWMCRTRSLADCIWAHAVTNGCLSAYVLAAGKWEYWF